MEIVGGIDEKMLWWGDCLVTCDRVGDKDWWVSVTTLADGARQVWGFRDRRWWWWWQQIESRHVAGVIELWTSCGASCGCCGKPLPLHLSAGCGQGKGTGLGRWEMEGRTELGGGRRVGGCIELVGQVDEDGRLGQPLEPTIVAEPRSPAPAPHASPCAIDSPCTTCLVHPAVRPSVAGISAPRGGMWVEKV